MMLSNEDDKNKIIKIYEEYRSLMFYIAKSILKEHAQAEDAVSESFVKLIHNLHKIDEISSPKTKSFISLIVKNTALNIYNKNAYVDLSVDLSPESEFENIVDNAPQIVDEIISKDGYEDLVDIINSLPSVLRDVAVLSFLHDLNNKEIAKITGIGYDTIRKRGLRAKNSIKKIWLNSNKESEKIDKLE